MPLISLKKFSKKRKTLKGVVLAGGAFDIVHSGHIKHLKKAKSLGRVLIIHITGDKRVREKKGVGRPLSGEEDRATIIEALKFVDYVFIYNGRHYDQRVIDIVKPDILFFNKEDAYSGDVMMRVNNLRGFKGKVVISSLKKTRHSASIIKKILKLK